MVINKQISNTVVIDHCPVCGFSEQKIVVEADLVPDRIDDSPYRLRIAKCQDCGHEYQTQIWDEAQLKQFYHSDATYYRDDHTVIPETTLLRFNTILQDLEPYLQPEWVHLDVGGFSGHFSRFIASRIQTSDCLDVSSYLPFQALSKIRIINKTLFEHAFCSDSPQYDFISLNHTLEHLADLEKTKIALDRLLSPDGYLFIEVPDQREQDESIIDYTLDHLHYFSSNSLFQWLSDQFEVEFLKRIKYKNKVDVGQIAILRALVRKKETQMTSSEAEKGRAKDIIQAIERKIQDTEELYVWGSGYHTRFMFSMSEMIHRKTTKIIDSDKARDGRILFGKKVVHPSRLEKQAHPWVIISSFDYCEDIERAAKTLFSIEHIINPYSL